VGKYVSLSQCSAIGEELGESAVFYSVSGFSKTNPIFFYLLPMLVTFSLLHLSSYIWQRVKVMIWKEYCAINISAANISKKVTSVLHIRNYSKTLVSSITIMCTPMNKGIPFPFSQISVLQISPAAANILLAVEGTSFSLRPANVLMGN
jgi:hypothetical protein